MFTGNYHCATWGNCEPVWGNFLFVYLPPSLSVSFFLFNLKDLWDLYNLRDSQAVDIGLHSCVTGSESVFGSDAFCCFIVLVPCLALMFSSSTKPEQEV